MFEFSDYSAKSKYYDDANKLVVGKWKMKQLLFQLKNESKAKDVFLFGEQQ